MTETEVIKVTKVYGERRTQIPTEICKEKAIQDGDSVQWMRIVGSGTIILEPTHRFHPIQ